MKITISILLILASITAQAQDSVLLNQNSPAPFTGYLLPPEKVQEFQNMSYEINTDKVIIQSYEKTITLYKSNEDLYNKKVQALNDQNDRLAESLGKARGLTDLERALWFVGGVLMVYGTARALK